MCGSRLLRRRRRDRDLPVSRWKHVLRVASDEVAGGKEVGDDEPLAVT